MHRSSFSLALALVAALAAAGNAQQVELLNFTADSCPACRHMEPVVNGLVRAGAPIRQIDANRHRDLTGRFRITHLPTFVVLANGQEIDRHVGATSADRLQQMLQQAENAASSQPPLVRGQSPHEQDAAPGMAADTRPGGTNPPVQASGLDEALIAASVRLRVEDPRGVSYGTGTIIHAADGEAIVLTCGHLFRESQGKLPVQVELFQSSAATPSVAGVVEGEVLSYDLTRDLGFIRIRPPQPVRAAPVADRVANLQPGEKACSVGCDHGKDPTVWHTRLTAIDRYSGPANVEAAGTPVQGRSGGGLFNQQGELIGVCFAADEQGNEGLYVGLAAIYEELDRLGLNAQAGSHALASSPNASSAAAAQQVSPPNLARQNVPAGFSSSDSPAAGRLASTNSSANSAANPSGPRSTDAASKLVAVPPVDAAQDSRQPLSAHERAALDEIAERSVGSEVIVIVRPRAPGARCEIFSLENSSEEFVNQLTALGSKATHPRFTSHQQETGSSQQPAPAQKISRRNSADRARPARGRGIDGWEAVSK